MSDRGKENQSGTRSNITHSPKPTVFSKADPVAGKSDNGQLSCVHQGAVAVSNQIPERSRSKSKGKKPSPARPPMHPSEQVTLISSSPSPTPPTTPIKVYSDLGVHVPSFLTSPMHQVVVGSQSGSGSDETTPRGRNWKKNRRKKMLRKRKRLILSAAAETISGSLTELEGGTPEKQVKVADENADDGSFSSPDRRLSPLTSAVFFSPLSSQLQRGSPLCGSTICSSSAVPSLSDSAIARVMTYLPGSDLFHVSISCKRFHSIFSHSSLVRKHVLRLARLPIDTTGYFTEYVYHPVRLAFASDTQLCIVCLGHEDVDTVTGIPACSRCRGLNGEDHDDVCDVLPEADITSSYLVPSEWRDILPLVTDDQGSATPLFVARELALFHSGEAEGLFQLAASHHGPVGGESYCKWIDAQLQLRAFLKTSYNVGLPWEAPMAIAYAEGTFPVQDAVRLSLRAFLDDNIVDTTPLLRASYLFESYQGIGTKLGDKAIWASVQRYIQSTRHPYWLSLALEVSNKTASTVLTRSDIRASLGFDLSNADIESVNQVGIVSLTPIGIRGYTYSSPLTVTSFGLSDVEEDDKDEDEDEDKNVRETSDFEEVV